MVATPQPDPPNRATINACEVLEFDVPASIEGDRALLAADIRNLGVRVAHHLAAKDARRDETLDLLASAANVGVFGASLQEGRNLYERAEGAYLARIETMNRLLYLGGVAAGIVLALIVGFIVFVVNDRSSDVFGDEIDATSLIVLVPLLASAGSLASVLSRLDTITELRNDAGWRRVWISGFSKPVVAALFATVVAIIIDSKVVDFGIDSDGVTPKQVEITAVASFLCGYTERFGIDVLSSVPFPGNKQG